MKTKTPVQKIVPGTTFRSPYADSNPLWKVIKSKGRGVYLCEIVNEPIKYNGRLIDSDWAGTQKAFLSTEIRASIGWSNTLDELHSSQDDFYKSLRVGQIIHYNNGFDNWVRCTVVKENGENVLKPFALVGIWKHDLPKRCPDGTISWSYYPEKIAKGETFTPNASNLFEFGCKPRNGINPNTYKPIDLTVPPMTEEQQKVADLWQKVYAVREALNGDHGDPAQILQNVRQLVNCTKD